MHQFCWRFLQYIETFVDHLGGNDIHMGSVPVLRNSTKFSKYMGSGEVNISVSIRATCTKFFWRFLTHIETSLGHLGGVDTPVSRVPAPKIWTKLNKYMGEGDISIPASIRALCTKFCLEIPETHRNISDYLGGVDTPVGRVPVHKIWAKLSK